MTAWERLMQATLRNAADQFARYADYHLAKNPPDREKAATNVECAAVCREAATDPDKAGSKPSLPRYKATDPVPRDFLAIDGDRFPLCPKCGGEADLIARPKEAPVWICGCGWEQAAG